MKSNSFLLHSPFLFSGRKETATIFNSLSCFLNNKLLYLFHDVSVLDFIYSHPEIMVEDLALKISISHSFYYGIMVCNHITSKYCSSKNQNVYYNYIFFLKNFISPLFFFLYIYTVFIFLVHIVFSSSASLTSGSIRYTFSPETSRSCIVFCYTAVMMVTKKISLSPFHLQPQYHPQPPAITAFLCGSFFLFCPCFWSAHFLSPEPHSSLVHSCGLLNRPLREVVLLLCHSTSGSL